MGPFGPCWVFSTQEGKPYYRIVHVSVIPVCITRCEASTEQDKLALVRLLLRLGLHTVARSLSVQAASRDQNLNQVASLASLGQVRMRSSGALWCGCGLLKAERYVMILIIMCSHGLLDHLVII